MTGAHWGENVDGLTELPRRPIQLKWYESDVERVFPRGTDVFRLGLMTQAAVNFPPLSAKYIYERFTNHIKNQDTINIYDPCAGWGGRLMGAISIDDRNIHYIGNDPNTENFIEDLGITRYEYLADFYNTRVTGAANPFWGHKNTLDIFQIGSEEIHLNERFKKYKGKLDFVFTSPPYFDRERYSNDDTQSYKKFNTYEKWRDGFLKPTLTTAYEWLRNDRYILWNIADIRIGKDSYTLEQDSIDILTKLGCKYQGKIKLGMTGKFGPIQAGTKNSTLLDGVLIKYEPIFVFYKP
jgi:hypothetical protein